MKKNLLLSIAAVALITTHSTAADYADLKGLSVLKVDCGSGPAGFEVIIKYTNAEDSILFNSCEKKMK